MNIFQRLNILSSYLQTDLDRLRSAVFELHQEGDAPKRSDSHLYNLFKAPKLGKKGGPVGASASLMPSKEESDLIHEAATRIAEQKSKPLGPSGRIDAPILDFLRLCRPSPDLLSSHMAPRDRDIVAYMDEFSIRKREFLPDSAVISNDKIYDYIREYPDVFSLIRQVSYPDGEAVLASEKLEIVSSSSLHIGYTDHRNHYYQGPLFVSKDKLVALAFSKESEALDLRFAVITIFSNPIESDGFLVCLSRSGFFERKVHSYNCVAFGAKDRLERPSEARPYRLNDLNYYHLLNSGFDAAGAFDSNFVVSFDAARKSLDRGKSLANQARKDGISDGDFLTSEQISNLNDCI